MQTVKLTLKPYLAEYLQKRYPATEPGLVKLPPSSHLYYLVLASLRTRPKGAEEDGNVELMLPNPSPYSGKRRPYRINYLAPYAKDRIASVVYAAYWEECHRYMERRIHVHGDTIIGAASSFISVHGLTLSNEDAILKNYQRWRRRFHAPKERKT